MHDADVYQSCGQRRSNELPMQLIEEPFTRTLLSLQIFHYFLPFFFLAVCEKPEGGCTPRVRKVARLSISLNLELMFCKVSDRKE